MTLFNKIKKILFQELIVVFIDFLMHIRGVRVIIDERLIKSIVCFSLKDIDLKNVVAGDVFMLWRLDN